MYSKLEGQTLTMGMLKTKDWLLWVADFLWSAVVVAPLVVLYWRGSWDLLDDIVSSQIFISLAKLKLTVKLY